MKKTLIFLIAVILIPGCASRPSKYPSKAAVYDKQAVIELNKFCKQYNLKYDYDTIDDMVTLSAPDLDIKVLLGSQLVYCNGRIFAVKKAPFYSGGIIFVPAELINFVLEKPKEIRRESPISVRTIVLDPGHGGKDPGAVSKRGLKEKTVNLLIAKYLKEELTEKGFKVFLTRDDDIYLTLAQRVRFAQEKEADLFVSIHVNANRSSKIKGFEVYYLSEKYFDSESKAVVMSENASLNVDEREFSQNTKRIIWDLICTENDTVSLDFANIIISTFKRMGFYVRALRGAPFYVLKYACVPSVLVEVGYITNVYEENLLRKAYYQQQIAQGIALSVDLLNRRYVKLLGGL
ncbi:MAG: N-acetylmuramoyl-L-alanine amidase [Candidatus Omnitrophota bacterium]